MTNKQAFIIGISFIIGLIVHGFIVQEKYQLSESENMLNKINTKTGEVFTYKHNIFNPSKLYYGEWIPLPLPKPEEPKAE